MMSSYTDIVESSTLPHLAFQTKLNQNFVFLKAQIMLFIAGTQLFLYNSRTLTVDFLLLLAVLTLLLSE